MRRLGNLLWKVLCDFLLNFWSPWTWHLQIKVNKVNIIDSYNFIPFALSKFPKAFELNELAKGYFPHLFNTRENQNKVFPTHPDIKFYQDKYMKCEEREKFLNWYAVNRNKQFDLNHELYKYCESDVDILKRGVLTFRRLFIDLTNVDPFKKSITIASFNSCFEHSLWNRTQFRWSKTAASIQHKIF